MSILFSFQLQSLTALAASFKPEDIAHKKSLIKSLEKLKLPKGEKLLAYHEVLLFLSAHPFDEEQLMLAKKELNRITKFVKTRDIAPKSFLYNSGLPFSAVYTHFSHDFLLQLMQEPKLKVEFVSMDENEIDWNQLLRITLPMIERSNTTAGYYFSELLEVLKVGEKQKFSFILDQFHSLNQQAFLKDEWFAKLNIQVKVSSKDDSFSRNGNFFCTREVFFHHEILKRFDHVELLNTPIDLPESLGNDKLADAIRVVRYSMALTARETDPCTYMDESTFKLYTLERGISVALYTMVNQRQLPLESYVGYTLLKNGFPAAYGGAWIFGERAHFGINIFEAFRGGESGYVLCQLLRTYKQVFNLKYFEVEPYQYGLENPEGISSGAFWFYYRYGFRPIDKDLNKLATAEFKKIKTKVNYRSNEKTLIRFTESNIAMDIGVSQKLGVLDVTKKVSSFISTNYKGIRTHAINDCLNQFVSQTAIKLPDNHFELSNLTDLLLMAKVLNKFTPPLLKDLPELAKAKCQSPYSYQKLLSNWLKE